MIFGSVCSGIESASVAWHPLGWRAAFVSEIDAFPRAVLAHHYPDVPLHGDFTTIAEGQYAAIDVLVGGTPCQSFSIAGLRKGLGDERGNLALEFCLLARRLRPRWVVWENVPGVLSLDGGRAFASILGGLAECGYGLAYRVLDAQFVRVDGFGRAVPQRRRRVFVVGCLGDWRCAAAVLFERESLSGNPPPRRQKGESAAPTLAARTRGCGGLGTDAELDGALVAHTLNGKGGAGRSDSESETFLPVVAGTLGHNQKAAGSATNQDAEQGLLVAHALRADGFDASEDGTGRGTPLVPVRRGCEVGIRSAEPITFDETQITSAENRGNPQPGDPCHPLAAKGRTPTLAFHARQDPDSGPVTHPLDTDGSSIGILDFVDASDAHAASARGWRVRRLTPTECERLQGFPDGYTAIPYRGKEAADGPRYKALGNSMAVNVMRWIGTRIQMVEEIP